MSKSTTQTDAPTSPSEAESEQQPAEAAAAEETTTAVVEAPPSETESAADDPAPPVEEAGDPPVQAGTEDADSSETTAAAGVEAEPSAGTSAKSADSPEKATAAKEGDAASDGSKGEAGQDEESEATRPGLAPELLEPLVAAHEEGAPIEGKVIGWNQGGFHVVLGTVPAFCPRSEMEVARPRAPKTYIDQTFRFVILRIEEEGRRIVLSRAAVQRRERAEKRKKARTQITPGAVLGGRVASLTDFGAFVDLGGVQGLVHVSEISRERVNKPSDVLSMGQTVQVKVLKVEQGGRRISLSMKALAPDPWKELSERLTAGKVVTGKVEKIAPFGVFVELEPGITGLLPASTVDLPMGTSLARRFHVNTDVDVQIMSVDPRRRRISLALEGSSVEGSRTDYQEYKKTVESDEDGGFNVLAAALKKARDTSD